MALVVKDRVKQQTTTTGTGTLTLSGSYTGFDTFSQIGDGNTTYYVITDDTTGDWEVGLGTYTAAGTPCPVIPFWHLPMQDPPSILPPEPRLSSVDIPQENLYILTLPETSESPALSLLPLLPVPQSQPHPISTPPRFL
jgi:hypothetical protein